MATSQQMAEGADDAMHQLAEDVWAAPTTAVFTFIGVLWLSLKIFSFWRMIASLFILPGTSVRLTHATLICLCWLLTDTSSPDWARKAAGL